MSPTPEPYLRDQISEMKHREVLGSEVQDISFDLTDEAHWTSQLFDIASPAYTSVHEGIHVEPTARL